MAAHPKTHPNNIKIMFWNANSVLNKRDVLHAVIKKQHLDIVLLSETFLKPGKKFNLPNMTIYRNDRDSKGGGTAIIVRRGITHHEIGLPTLTSIEANAIQIETRNGCINLISAYKPPGNTLDTTDIQNLFKSPLTTILAGDLNCKHQSWNSRRLNSNGTILHNFILKNDIAVVGPQEPTHYPDSGNRPDVLDIALFKNTKQSIHMAVIQELTSDHNPVILTYGDEVVTKDPAQKINTEHTDWEKFQQLLDSAIATANPIINNKTDIDEHIDYLTQTVTEALHESTPQPKTSPKTYLDLPPNIMMAIRARNKIRKQWQRSRDKNMKTKLNTMTGEIQKMIQDHRNDKWNSKIESLNIKDHSIWKMTKAVLNIPTKVPPLHGVNGMAYSDQSKANAFADTLESTFTPHNDPSNIDAIEEVEEEVDRINDLTASAKDINIVTPREVRKIIQRLKNKKAPGLDLIPNQAMKHLTKKATVYLTKIFNSMLKLQYFSINMKKSKVILFPKPGKDQAFPQNYRPISLLTVISKIFERILLNRLQVHIDENNILNPEQCGFRQAHSTNHQLLRLTDKIVNGFNTNRSTGVIFLDIAQAFDRVWHQGLIYKLIKYNFPLYLIQTIQSYLSDRSFEVHHGSAISTTRLIEAGVPQGSILGPTLFNLFINDLPQTPQISLSLYADDTALVAQSLNGSLATKYLQTALDNLEEYYERWRIKINVSKSVAVLFSKKRGKKTKTGRLTLFNETIPWKKEAKYLGVTMDQRLTWSSHVRETTAKATKRLGMLYPLINRISKLSLNNSLTLYKSLIKPILTYACPIWGTTCKTNINKLQAVQNKATRIITKSPWFVRNMDIHNDIGMHLIKTTIADLALNFYNKVPTVPNELINNLASYNIFEKTKYKRPMYAIY